MKSKRGCILEGQKCYTTIVEEHDILLDYYVIIMALFQTSCIECDHTVPHNVIYRAISGTPRNNKTQISRSIP
jgi:hypothetical protein